MEWFEILEWVNVNYSVAGIFFVVFVLAIATFHRTSDRQHKDLTEIIRNQHERDNTLEYALQQVSQVSTKVYGLSESLVKSEQQNNKQWVSMDNKLGRIADSAEANNKNVEQVLNKLETRDGELASILKEFKAQQNKGFEDIEGKLSASESRMVEFIAETTKAIEQCALVADRAMTMTKQDKDDTRELINRLAKRQDRLEEALVTDSKASNARLDRIEQFLEQIVKDRLRTTTTEQIVRKDNPEEDKNV